MIPPIKSITYLRHLSNYSLFNSLENTQTDFSFPTEQSHAQL
nr:MAG TPA: hypothetical protein [Caudoviricetes sp.]